MPTIALYSLLCHPIFGYSNYTIADLAEEKVE